MTNGLNVATGTEAQVCGDIANRQAHGIAKYGTSVADNPLTQEQWLQHMYEELLDGAVYAKRLINEMQKQKNLVHVAWLHRIEEPDRPVLEMLSRSPECPWGHWVQSHIGLCKWSVQELYGSSEVSHGLPLSATQKIDNRASSVRQEMLALLPTLETWMKGEYQAVAAMTTLKLLINRLPEK